MKQKRKVKCLIPQRNDWSKNILSALLFILSVILCVGSASLLTSCARAADIYYTGLDENAEALYDISFVDSGNINKIVNKMYLSGDNFYITPAPVIVNNSDSSNVNIIRNVSGHILGGKKNELVSDNITLIGGQDNGINPNNNNSTFMGGNNNKLYGTNSQFPRTIIGGNNYNLSATRSGGNIFIGGGNIGIRGWGNKITNSIFLGLQSFSFTNNLNNVIMGGNDVTLYLTPENSFIYSNYSYGFIPETSNAFYLNMSKGVGINRGAADIGLAVGGAVSFGEINRNDKCETNTLGVIGSYSGCLVGCTEYSSGKHNTTVNGDIYYYNPRELLDTSDQCKTICKNRTRQGTNNRKRCIYTGEESSIDTNIEDYTSFCLTGNSIYNFDNTVLCYDQINYYKNVVFEATLTGNCPTNNKNICVYGCKAGYDFFDINGVGKCIEGCYININGESRYLKHNGTGEYDIRSKNDSCDEMCQKQKVICSEGHLYKASENWEISEEFGTKDLYEGCTYRKCCDFGEEKIMDGNIKVFYKTGSVTCTGACEGAEFTCNNGNWNNEQSGYTALSCNLEGKICSGYNITQKYYDEIILDKGYDKLGTYKKCTEYNVNNSNLCTTGETKYMLEGCNNGYHVHNPTPGNYDYCESNYHITACPGEVPENGHRLNNVKIIKNGKEEYAGTGKYFVEYICPRNITNPEGNNCRYHDSKKYCKWECDEGYRKARDDRAEHLICKSERKNDYNCISPDDHAYLVEGTDEGLTENITGTLFQFTGDITGKCAYLCDNDGFYYYFNGKCEPFIETKCDYDNDNCESPSTKGNGSGFYETENGSKRNCILIGNDGDPIIKKCAYCNSGFSIYISGELYGGYIDNMSPEQFNEFECLKQPTCNHCAKSGFPYCFPIDFRDSCDEFRWAASRENGIGYGSGV